jgi:hypothetical protein
LGLVPLSLFLLESWAPVPQTDDAYISYRYALNLVEGLGLVFNAGERVEGYTNLLWTLLIAAGVALGFAAPSVTHVLSLASGAMLLLSSQLHAAQLLPAGRRWLSIAAPLALLASSSFACWTASGLETPLFAALLTFALVAYTASRIGWSCVLCVLATLTRPEGALAAALLLGSAWVRSVVDERPSSVRRLLAVSTPCLAFAGYLATHTLFRLYYYADFVPNTFHAKVGGIPIARGFAYVVFFLADGPGLLLPAALAGWLLARKARMGAALTAVTLLYAISIGGDVFRLGRFLLPALPAMIAAAMAGSHRVFERSRILGLLLGLTLPGFALYSLYGIWPNSPDFVGVSREPSLVSAKRTSAREDHDRFTWAIGAKVDQIRGIQPPVKTLATIGIGKIGYYLPDVAILDLVGLTDRHIARSPNRVEGAWMLPGHQRTDADYVLDRRPDVIWIPRSGIAITLPCVLELRRNPRLDREFFWDERLQFYRRRPTPAVQVQPDAFRSR